MTWTVFYFHASKEKTFLLHGKKVRNYGHSEKYTCFSLQSRCAFKARERTNRARDRSGSGVTPLLCSEPSSCSQCCCFLLQPTRPYLICYLSDLDFYSSPSCLLDSTHHDGLRLVPPTSQSFSASGPLHLLTSLPGMFLPQGSIICSRSASWVFTVFADYYICK